MGYGHFINSAHVVVLDEPLPTDGLRARKKLRTRLAIQDAALDLFAVKGYEATTVDEISARAEVSTTTFFAYFPSKGEVILHDQNLRLASLRQAIVESPSSESDLTAVRRAINEHWLADVDPGRTARKARAVASSHVLRGLTYDTSETWLRTIADALAQRRGLDEAGPGCWLTARVSLTLLNHGVEAWMLDGQRGEVAAAVDRAHDLMGALAHEWFEHTVYREKGDECLQSP